MSSRSDASSSTPAPAVRERVGLRQGNTCPACKSPGPVQPDGPPPRAAAAGPVEPDCPLLATLVRHWLCLLTEGARLHCLPPVGVPSVRLASLRGLLCRLPTLQAALTQPSPDSAPLHKHKIFVDLFAGASAPLSAAMSGLGLARLEPLDKLHGCHFDLLDDSQYRELCALASSGAVGAASAAPPCAPFSRARLRPGGPAPVRTPAHPTGIPSPSQAQQRELSESAELHSRARHFLALVAAQGGLIILENPASSLLWLDPSVRAWLSVHAPFCTHIAASQFGLALPKVAAAVLTLRVFTPHLRESATPMAPLPPAKRPVTLSRWQRPLPSAISEQRHAFVGPCAISLRAGFAHIPSGRVR